MTNMVERVARAIAASISKQDGYERTPEDALPADLTWAWIDQGEVNFAEVARAAIGAMRGLDPEFERFAVQATLPYHDQGVQWWRGHMPGDLFRIGWDAMISAALAEEG